jgi:2,3-bisphosphoglycerate-dependent phosphoglycerate mutase
MQMTTNIAVEDDLYYITLLRHGESTGNVQGLLQGQVDYELSALGRQQSEHLALRWLMEGVHFDWVISSPLRRARQTAEIIAAALNVPIDYDPDWMERDFGKLSGKLLSEEDLTILRNNFKIPSEPLGKTGESQWDTFYRAERAIAKLLNRSPGRYLVVAHGGIINQTLHVILELPPRIDSDGARFIISNAAFAFLSYAPQEQLWRMFRLNDNQHLAGMSDEPPTAQEVDQKSSIINHEADIPIKPKVPLSYKIRPALISDLDGLTEVFTETDRLHAIARPDIFCHPPVSFSSRAYYETQLSQPDVVLLAAEAVGEIVGCLHAVIKEAPKSPFLKPRNWLSINNIAVKPAYRGQGVGQALMNQAQSLVAELGLHSIELVVWEFNNDARNFYKQLGYTTSRRVLWLKGK